MVPWEIYERSKNEGQPWELRESPNPWERHGSTLSQHCIPLEVAEQTHELLHAHGDPWEFHGPALYTIHQ